MGIPKACIKVDLVFAGKHVLQTGLNGTGGEYNGSAQP
jgi:hypothetical protein